MNDPILGVQIFRDGRFIEGEIPNQFSGNLPDIIYEAPDGWQIMREIDDENIGPFRTRQDAYHKYIQLLHEDIIYHQNKLAQIELLINS
jgi:hypothetical protein